MFGIISNSHTKIKRASFCLASLYISLNEEHLTAKIRQMLSEMKATANERKGAQIRISKESQFTLHVGVKDVIEAYSRIASQNKDTRALKTFKVTSYGLQS